MTDSSEYKMYGNGISLPTALYVMQGIAEVLKGVEDSPGMVEKKGEPVGLKGPVAWCPSCGAKDIKWDAEKDICVCMTCGRIIK